MWAETANSFGWRSPQASAGTPNNTREPARSDKKKPQPRTVGVLLLVAEGEYEVSFGRMRIHAERCGFLRISEGTCWHPTRGVLNDALPNHITLFVKHAPVRERSIRGRYALSVR